MRNLLIRLAVSAGVVLLVQWVFDRLAPPEWQLIEVDDWLAAVIFAVVLGLLNAIVRPILLILTCPFTLITLGLFVFVVNALVFWLAAQIVPGVDVKGFWGALFGSLAVTISTAIVDRHLEPAPSA
jgi:putative membrane protein